MKYIISEEELKELLVTLKVETAKADVIAKWFVKDKQPVELVAEGIAGKINHHIYINRSDLGKLVKIYMQKKT